MTGLRRISRRSQKLSPAFNAYGVKEIENFLIFMNEAIAIYEGSITLLRCQLLSTSELIDWLITRFRNLQFFMGLHQSSPIVIAMAMVKCTVK